MVPYVVYEFIMRIAQYGSICWHKVFLAQYDQYVEIWLILRDMIPYDIWLILQNLIPYVER